MTRILPGEPTNQPSLVRQVLDGVNNKLSVGVEVSPEEELYDLKLPDDIISIIAPLLKNLGFQIEPSQVVDSFSPEKYHYTLLVRDRIKRLLLHVPDHILASPSKENWHAVNYMLSVFINNCDTASRIIIFGWVIPKVAYDMLMNQVAERHGIPVEFIAFSKIKDLEQLPSQAGEQFLRLVLAVEGMSGRETIREKPWIGTINYHEISRLVKIVCGLSNFLTASERKTIIEYTELNSAIGEFDYSGSAEDVARRMILKLLDFGPLDKSGGVHAYQRFLEFVRASNPAREDSEFVKQILEKYDFG